MQVREEMTLAGVSLVVSFEAKPEEIEKLAKAYMRDVMYRTVASKAFKGVEKRKELTFEKADELIRKAMPSEFVLVSSEPYVAPEKQSEMKRATKLFDDLNAKGAEAVAKAAKNLGLEDNASSDEIIQAIHKAMQNPLSLLA